jgi:NTE family protein
MSDSTGKPTALVLAGGGSFGAVQVGMLRALVSYGIVPDLVVGSSVGAINGAYFAGAPSAEGVARLAAIWRGLRRNEVFPFTWRSLFGLLARRDSLVAPGALRELIEQRLPYRTIEQAAVPLHVVATDLLGGGTVRLSSGPVVDAVLASCAIPGAFPPVRIGARHLIDGAVASNTPIAVAIELGAKRLIVLPTGYACSLAAPPRGAIASALHAITLLISHQLVAELERCRDQAEIITVPPLCPLAVSPYDFSRAGDLIDRAAAQTDRWLDRGGFTRERVPPALRAHTHAGPGSFESENACERLAIDRHDDGADRGQRRPHRAAAGHVPASP